MYIQSDSPAAMNMARLEMGADAMLVSSRRTDEQSLHLGEYEVVFASISPNDARSSASGAQSQHSANVLALRAPPPLAKPQAKLHARPIDRLSEEVAGLKHEMDRLASALSRSTAINAKIAANAELAEAFSQLVDAEMDAGLAQDILWRVTSQIDNGPPLSAAHTNGLVAGELSRLFNVDSRLAGNAGRNAIAVVGPPGSGKTTVLVKLAVLYGLRTRRPSQIISLDTHRVAATEQLRSYAAVTGIGFQALETPRALAQALEEHRNKDLIFIDTPGLAGNDFEDAAAMAALISKQPRIETHLVLSASMKPADLKRIALQYELFAPTKLIFTHLDETRTFGPLLSLSIKTGKPVSFVSRGQQVPEDLEPADRRTLVALVISEEYGEKVLSTEKEASGAEFRSTAAA